MRHGPISAGIRKGREQLRRHERAVHGENHTDVMGRCPQRGYDTHDRRTDIRAVVEDGEWEVESVSELAHGDPLLAKLAEHAPAPLRERLAVEPRQRLRRSEPRRSAPDEQRPGQWATRHASE